MQLVRFICGSARERPTVEHGSGAAAVLSLASGFNRGLLWHWEGGIAILRMLWRTRSCCMTTEQMAHMSEQLQQLCQQLSVQQEMLQQILETQKQQSRVQMETLINLGAGQVAKVTSDAHDFQTKAFSEMRGEMCDENGCSGWVYKFLIEAAGCFRQVAAILDWAENRHDQPLRKLRS